jgi:tripartite-type tricarboxylate transporter receptor subunit TctC
MKKLLTAVMAGILFCAAPAMAAETITIMNPYGPSHSATPAVLKIIDVANSQQSQYKFVLEFKPGGMQTIAVKALDQDPQNRLAVVAPAFVKNTIAGRLQRSNYRPIFSLGNACWAVVSNLGTRGSVASLRGKAAEVVVGGVGVGNATHLTSLAIGDAMGFKVNYTVFKSNNDALVNMAGNNGVNFIVDLIDHYEALKDKNKDMQVIAASCPKRLESAPDVPTLAEQGIKAPYIFNITVAHKTMNKAKAEKLGRILSNATHTIGEKEIFKLSGMRPVQFDGQTAQSHFDSSITLIEGLLNKYSSYIPKK